MALNIKNAEAERLARALTEATGESITQAVIHALEERLLKVQGRRSARNLKEEIDEIGKRCAALPDLDKRSVDEILGYDSFGVPE